MRDSAMENSYDSEHTGMVSPRVRYSRVHDLLNFKGLSRHVRFA